MLEYYTYAYLREDKTPYYVGKGKGYRIDDKKHSVSLPPRNRRLILKYFSNESDAFKHEIYMISILGRKDKGTGMLRNNTDGGEGTSGIIRSEEHLRALNEGRKSIYTEQHSKKISNTLKEKKIKPPTAKGKKWWYNTKGETAFDYEPPASNWINGRPSIKKWLHT